MEIVAAPALHSILPAWALVLIFGQVLAPSCFAAGEPEPSTLTVDQAVTSALTDNAQVKNSQLELEITKKRVAIARSHFLPKMKVSSLGLQLLTPLKFDFGRGVFGDFESTGPIPREKTSVTTDQKPALFVNVAVAQPILQLPKIDIAVKQSQLARQMASEKVRQQKQQITNQVRNTYYKILELEATRKVIDDTIALFVEADRVTTNYLRQRTVLPADALEVTQQLAAARLESLRLLNALASQHEQLDVLLGQDVATRFKLVSPGLVPPQAASLEEARTRALTARPELRQLAYQSRQIELEKRLKKLSFLPDLSVVVDYFSVFGTEVLPRNVALAGLFLNWEPVDWGRTGHEVAIQKKMLNQSANSMRELRSQVLLEVQSAFRRQDEAAETLKVMTLGQELSTEKLRVVTNKYKEQSALLKDVLAAQRDLSQANSKYTQAVLSFWSARADYARALGED